MIMTSITSFIITVSVITMSVVVQVENNGTSQQNGASTVGNKVFRGVLKTKARPIDKSLLIKDILEDESFKVILISRPRRFGKSTNLSMLKSFLSNTEPSEKSEKLFAGLEIMDPKYEKLRADNMNKHPVIYISFETIKAKTYKGAFDALKLVMKEVYKSHLYLLDGPTLSKANRDRFMDVICENDVSQRDLIFAANRMSRFLRDQFNKSAIILIDDYDKPLAYAYKYGYLTDMVHLLKSMLHVTLKSNNFYNRSVVFGVTKVSLGEIGANNARPFTLFQPEYDRYFGFDQKEVKNLINHFAVTPKIFTNVSRWYGGYLMGKSQTHIPESVIRCLSTKGEFITTWSKAVSPEPLRKLLLKQGLLPILHIQHLLNGLQVQKGLKMFSFMLPDLEHQEAAFWVYLVYTGYVTITELPVTTVVANLVCDLRIPNDEIRLTIKGIIDDFVKQEVIPDYDQFIQSLVNDDTVFAKKWITKYIEKSGRYFCELGNVGTTMGVVKFSKYVVQILKGLEKVYGSRLTAQKTPERAIVSLKCMRLNHRDYEFTIVQACSKAEFDKKFTKAGLFDSFLQSTKKALLSIYKKSEVRQVVIGYCVTGCESILVSVEWIS